MRCLTASRAAGEARAAIWDWLDPKSGARSSATARSRKPVASAVDRADADSGPTTTRATGTPSSSHEMASRELREVHVAQSPTAMTNAAYLAAMAAAHRKGS